MADRQSIGQPDELLMGWFKRRTEELRFSIASEIQFQAKTLLYAAVAIFLLQLITVGILVLHIGEII